MTERGYFLVALERPKLDSNVGGVLRAAHVFGGCGVVIAGQRFRREASDTSKAWRHIPILVTEDVLDVLPYDCNPIAVELVAGATPLPRFQHPERAMYVFGPEDGSVSKETLERCVSKIIIPSRHCLNLAAAVNVVLYDRVSKSSARAA